MQLGPSLDQSVLSYRQRPRDQFHRGNSIDGHRVLVISVEMRLMMWSRRLGKHPNDDPEESGKFWHDCDSRHTLIAAVTTGKVRVSGPYALESNPARVGNPQ